MLLTSLLTIVLASLARNTLAQDEFGPIKYDDIHNATAITGTWSTGSKAVSTGAVSSSILWPSMTDKAHEVLPVLKRDSLTQRT